MDVIFRSNSKSNMALLTELAKKLKVSTAPLPKKLSKEMMEAMEDAYLIKQIEEGMASGLADRDTVLRELGLK